MEYGSLPEIMAGVTALIVAFGGGIKWMLMWSDKKVQAIQLQLEQQYAERFASLEQRVTAQYAELKHQRESISRYLRHVGRLEGLLQANGIDVPQMEK